VRDENSSRVERLNVSEIFQSAQNALELWGGAHIRKGFGGGETGGDGQMQPGTSSGCIQQKLVLLLFSRESEEDHLPIGSVRAREELEWGKE
jgi:hypothetical protein